VRSIIQQWNTKPRSPAYRSSSRGRSANFVAQTAVVSHSLVRGASRGSRTPQLNNIALKNACVAGGTSLRAPKKTQ
jgi:hypothetical protein